jgi:hypothetical protein
VRGGSGSSPSSIRSQSRSTHRACAVRVRAACVGATPRTPSPSRIGFIQITQTAICRFAPITTDGIAGVAREICSLG